MKSPDNKLSIVIAEDHETVREGLITILSKNTNHRVVAMVNDGMKLIDVVNEERVDLILLDLNLPVISGLEAAKIIKQKFPHIKIMVVTNYYDLKIINLLKTIGVNGYLPKDKGTKEFLLVLQKVINGEQCYFEKELNTIIDVMVHDGFADKFKLTKREIEIMVLIADGYSTKQVADKLFLSDQTVHTHRKNISHKIGSSESLDISKFLTQHLKS